MDGIARRLEAQGFAPTKAVLKCNTAEEAQSPERQSAAAIPSTPASEFGLKAACPSPGFSALFWTNSVVIERLDRQLTRREFLKNTSLAGLGGWFGFGGLGGGSANDKLNLGIIGTANRAGLNLAAVSGQNIVALCDTDETFLAGAAVQHPRAATYGDFRKLLERRDIDAVVISTADHTHAVATMMALKAGKHVYCEKPLTHSVAEARLVAKAASQTKLATQMGIQIHAERNYRRVVELIQSGAIGAVTEAHAFCSKTWSGGERPSDQPRVPKSIHFDVWLGPAPARPYHPAYIPEQWRRWWDFGNGTLGDMGCHYLDLVHWALDLRHPKTIAAQGPPPHRETTPRLAGGALRIPGARRQSSRGRHLV